MKHLTVSQGHLFYAREGAVVAQLFDEQTLEPQGPMITLAETDSAPWQPRPSASRTGIVVFRSSAASLRQLTWRGRQGDHLGVVGGPDLYSQVELSPLPAHEPSSSAAVHGQRTGTSGLPISRAAFPPG